MDNSEIHVNSERLKPLHCGSLTFRSSDDFSVTQKDIDKAREELHETEEVRKSALQEIRQKIADDPKMKCRTDDIFLLRYLRYAKFDCERAYKSLHSFYVYREKYPHVFSLSRLEQLLKMGFMTYLPYVDEDGCVIFLMDFKKWDISEWSISDILSLYHAVSDILTVNQNAQIYGVKGICDVRGLSFRHLAQGLNPSMIVLIVKAMQDLYPYRIKKIVSVHTGGVTRVGYNVIRPLLKRKLQDRIALLGSDMTELHKHYNPAILPKEYGGQLEDSECSIVQHVMDNINYLKYDHSFGMI